VLQFDPQSPPQSTSVSVFDLTPSLHERQTPASQRPEMQSLLPEQNFESTQSAAHEPPQSTSVSVAFLTLSAQVAARQEPTDSWTVRYLNAVFGAIARTAEAGVPL
jgi:hypothetical protein